MRQCLADLKADDVVVDQINQEVGLLYNNECFRLSLVGTAGPYPASEYRSVSSYLTLVPKAEIDYDWGGVDILALKQSSLPPS